MKKYITGIGSRETPIGVRSTIFDIAKEVIPYGFILRSGGADGADTYWEEAYDFYKGEKEIYLPWNGFNNRWSNSYEDTPQEAYNIAATIHPVWHKLSDGAKRLHARNVLQVLGKELNAPSDLVVSWTADGKASGGSATAMNLAKQYKIPVCNLFKKDDKVTLDHYIHWCIFQ